MKKTKSILIVILLIILGLSSFSFATMSEFKPEAGKEEIITSMVSLSDKQIEKGKEFYLILNLSKISFNKFKVDITNTSNLSANEITTQVADLSTNSVATTFVVDKASMSLERFGVVYAAPNESCKVNFEVKITSLDESEEELKEKQNAIQLEITTLTDNLTTLNETLKGIETDFETAKLEGLEAGTELYIKFETQISETKTTIKKVEADIQSKRNENEELTNQITNFTAEAIVEEVEIEVVEQVVSDEKVEDKFDKEDMFKMEEKNKEMTKDMEEMKSKMGDLENNLKNANDTISSLTKSVTYQGSQNNYLESLSIEGIEFKNSFKKTTVNYFATVDKAVSKVTVNATPEDASAVVTIYGNTDLEEGQNKILITVTADDGSVRSYKIYLTK